MTMAFCRHCGKEIQESASYCPFCGKAQVLVAGTSRNTGVLVLVGIGWMFIMWFGALMLGGFIIGFTHPSGAEEAGHDFGERAAFPLLLLTAILSGVLTKMGLLPGTGKK
jgi:hypothetical protein